MAAGFAPRPTRPMRPTSGGGLVGSSPTGGGIASIGGGFGGSIPAPGATSSAPAAGAPPQLTNTAEMNPEMREWLAKTAAAHTAAAGAAGQADPLLAEQVGNLRSRMGADTTARATAKAEARIRAQAAGQKKALASRLGRIDAPASSIAKLQGGIDEAARRSAAGATADIQLGRERDLDNLTLGGQGIMSAPAQYALQKQSIANGLLGMGVGAAGNAAQLGLQQQGLGLNMWEAANNANFARERLAADQRAQQEGQLMAMLRMFPPAA
jgi:hypothetical protein